MPPLRALILEDRQSDVELLIHQLRMDGFEPTWFRAETESDFLAQLDQPVDVILADYTLPTMNALDALEILQRKALDIPFIVVTGTVSEATAVACMKQGAADYLLKDQLTRLGAAVEQALESKRLRDRHQQLADRLRASDAQYRQLVELSPDAVLVYNARELLYINSAGRKRFLGLDDTQNPIGQNLLDFIHPDLRPDILKSILGRESDRSQSHRVELTLKLADGRELDVEFSSAPIVYDGKEARQSIVRDIAERKRAERALKASEQLARSTVDALTANIAILDDSGSVIAVNQAWRDYGASHQADAGSYLGINYLDLCAQADGPEADIAHAFASGIRAVMDGTLPQFSLEYPSHSPTEQAWYVGRITRFHGDGPVRLVIAHENITERKLAEMQVRRSEEKFSKLFSTSPEIIAFSSLEDGHYIEVNDGFVRAYGFTREELIGHTAMELNIWPKPEQRKQMIEQLRANGFAHDIEAQARCKSGEIRVILISAQMLEVNGERCFISVAKDITDRKLAEEDVRRHLLRTEALAELSRIFAEGQLEFRAIMDTVVDLVTRSIGDACVITQVSEDGRWLQPWAVRNIDSEAEQFMRQLYSSTQMFSDQGIGGRVFQSGEAVLIPETSVEEMRRSIPPQYRPYLERFGIHSLLIVPLIRRGVVVGTIGVSRNRPGRAYTEGDMTFLQAVSDRAGLAIENRRLFETVRDNSERIAGLARRVIVAQEEERRRLSRELHDEAGQSLTALKISLQLARDDIPQAFESVRSSIEEAVTVATQTMEHIRALSHDLRPPVLDTLDFGTALQAYCREFATRTRIETDYTGEPPRDLADTIKISLYRFLQEALTNVARHARAGHVSVKLSYTADEIGLMVEDNGVGFDTLTMQEAVVETGIGLPGLRERVELLGGRLTVESTVGQGTRLTASIPWTAQ